MVASSSIPLKLISCRPNRHAGKRGRGKDAFQTVAMKSTRGPPVTRDLSFERMDGVVVLAVERFIKQAPHAAFML